MVKVCEEIKVSPEEMRAAYCNALIEEAKKNPKIVTIDCDLMNSCGTKNFMKEFPDRAFNIGIQEQNAAAMAGGMASTGLIPFVHTFAVFASRRIYDQVFMSCAYAGQNVKICGCDAGIAATYNGGTHMAFEDMADLIEILLFFSPVLIFVIVYIVYTFRDNQRKRSMSPEEYQKLIKKEANEAREYLKHGGKRSGGHVYVTSDGGPDRDLGKRSEIPGADNLQSQGGY